MAVILDSCVTMTERLKTFSFIATSIKDLTEAVSSL